MRMNAMALLSVAMISGCGGQGGGEGPTRAASSSASKRFLNDFKGDVWSLTFSPDSKTLATGGSEIIIWDVAGKQEVLSFSGNKHVFRVCFSPDGKILASGGGRATEPGELKLWDVASGKELCDLQGHSRWIASVEFSPDGKILASGGLGPAAKLWNVTTHKELPVPGESQSIRRDGFAHLAFSRDGKLLALVHGSGDDIHLLNRESGKELKKLPYPGFRIDALAFSPDNLTLAAAGSDTVVYDVTSGKVRSVLQGHIQANCLAFHPSGKFLVTGGGLDEAKEVKLWDPQTCKEVATATNKLPNVKSVAISPDGKTLAAGTTNSKTPLVLWDFESISRPPAGK